MLVAAHAANSLVNCFEQVISKYVSREIIQLGRSIVNFYLSLFDDEEEIVHPNKNKHTNHNG